jgi:hypothetical protein
LRRAASGFRMFGLPAPGQDADLPVLRSRMSDGTEAKSIMNSSDRNIVLVLVGAVVCGVPSLVWGAAC